MSRQTANQTKQKPEKWFSAERVSMLVSVALGGFISIGTTFIASYLSIGGQKDIFRLERAQDFGDYVATKSLPRQGSYPEECQKRMEECIQLRRLAVRTYLFMPNKIQDNMIKSFGASAVFAVSPDAGKGLPIEEKAMRDALEGARQWATGEVNQNFDFTMPCADWKTEERLCKKP